MTSNDDKAARLREYFSDGTPMNQQESGPLGEAMRPKPAPTSNDDLKKHVEVIQEWGQFRSDVPWPSIEAVLDALEAATRAPLLAESREAVRTAIHRGVMPMAMSVFPALGGTQREYESFLDAVTDEVMRAVVLREQVEREDPYCREENCEYRHWTSGSMPTHRRGSKCPPRAESEGE